MWLGKGCFLGFVQDIFQREYMGLSWCGDLELGGRFWFVWRVAMGHVKCTWRGIWIGVGPKPQITKFIELRILRLKLIIYPKMKLFYKVNNIPCVISLWRLFLPSTFSEFNSITLYVYNIVVLLTSRWVRSIKYVIILGQNVDIILICI